MKYIPLTLICLLWIFIEYTNAKTSHKVHCTEDEMLVDLGINTANSNSKNNGLVIYLDGLKGYPDIRCQPVINETLAQFKLSLKDFYECGVTRMINKLTGKTVYYHKIIMEEENAKEIVSVKCITAGPIIYKSLNQTDFKKQKHDITRRDVLPAGFQEPEDLEITTSVTERAPEPILSVGVRQGGEIVTGELYVSPGTPLSMEIYLDKGSAPIYGLAVTYMQVTDTKNQEETIIFNGCSVDPYLFENFNTIDGDFLSAKFRAFKFPESTYVQFRATVNVCLDKCQGTPCSNGQVGYGRRKREVSKTSPESNKIYEFSLTTFIKVNEVDGLSNNYEVQELVEKIKQLKIANQKLARNSRGSNNNMPSMDQTQLGSASATVLEEDTILYARNAAAASFPTPIFLLLVFLRLALAITN